MTKTTKTEADNDTKTDAEKWRESIAGRCKAIQERLLDFAEQSDRRPPEGVRLAVEDIVLFAVDAGIEHPAEHAKLLRYAHHTACEMFCSLHGDGGLWRQSSFGYIASSRFTSTGGFCEELERLGGPAEPIKPRPLLESLAELEKLNHINDRTIVKIAWNVDESDPQGYAEAMEKLHNVRAGSTDLWPKYGGGWIKSTEEKAPHLGILQYVADVIRKERPADDAGDTTDNFRESSGSGSVVEEAEAEAIV